MAFRVYVAIEGATQGKFKGETAKGSHQGQIEAFGFSYEVEIPGAGAGGQAAKRKHSPVTFTKAWGATTPQLLQALYKQEPLTAVRFDFVDTASGTEDPVHVVKLTGARVVRVSDRLGLDPATRGPIEEVSLSFTKIEVTNAETTASDDVMEHI